MYLKKDKAYGVHTGKEGRHVFPEIRPFACRDRDDHGIDSRPIITLYGKCDLLIDIGPLAQKVKYLLPAGRVNSLPIPICKPPQVPVGSYAAFKDLAPVIESSVEGS